MFVMVFDGSHPVVEPTTHQINTAIALPDKSRLVEENAYIIIEHQ